MNLLLLAAGTLTIATGAAHSVLGELFLLRPLFARSDLPRLLGSQTFARQTLRFTWHLTTVLGLGIGAWLLAVATGPQEPQTAWTLRCLSLLFVACALVALVGSRGRHLSWLALLAVAATTWLGAS